MKLTTIFILSILIQVNAKGYSQKVSIDRNNANLEDVLIDINKQTGYSYSASSEALKRKKSFDIHVQNVDIAEVMEICLRDLPLTYMIKDKIITIRSVIAKDKFNKAEYTNRINVKGRILNEFQEPVVATIQEKGTRNAITSDLQGYFLLKDVDQNAVLIISAISIITKEAKVEGKSDLKAIFVTRDTKTIQEVVVGSNGYRKLKPSETGSYDVLDAKALNQQTGPNILDRIVIMGNGFFKNNNKTDAKGRPNPYTVRTIATINASTAPLIILDKFPFEGNIDNINPNDIESVTILKDAAATSQYGTRGGNGVIVITTKKGRFNQKANISMNSNIGITEQPDLYYLPRISSADYIDFEQFLFNQGYDFNGALNNTYSALTPAVEVFANRRAGLISALDSANQIDALKQIDSRQQIDNFFYSNAILQQYSVSVNGGSNNIAWIIAGGYNKSISTLSAKSDKVNLSMNNTYKPFKNAEIGFGLYYTNSTSKNGKPAPENLLLRQAPYILFADAYGNPLSISTKYRNSFTDIAGQGQLLSWKYFPLDDYKHDVSKAKTEQLIANIDFGYRFLDFLDLSLSYQYQKQSDESKRLSDMESFYTRDVINSFTNINAPINNLAERYPVPKGNILGVVNNALLSHSFRAQLQANKDLEDHAFSAIAGFEVRTVNGLGINTYTFYGYNENPALYGVVDFRSNFSDFITGNVSKIPGYPTIGSKTWNRNVSMYLTGAYIFRKKYSLNISARKDASNVFGLNANDKWNPLWSAGLGWELNRERFFQSRKISLLRLRTTWGYSGNIDISLSPIVILRYLPPESSTILSTSGFPGAAISGATNKDLKWEKVKQLNTGLDFATKNNFISGSFEYYIRWGLDLYGVTSFDYTAFGTASRITKNVANIRGTGIDIKLNTSNLRGALKWNSTFIINYAISKTTKYLTDKSKNGDDIIGFGSGSRITPVIGKPVYAIAAYRWAGLDGSGNPQGFVNGKLSIDYSKILAASGQGIYSKDVIYKGSSSPLLFGSFTNYFDIKGFSVSLNVSFEGLFYFRKSTISYQALIDQGTSHTDYDKRWRSPGDEVHTSIPSFIFPVPSFRDLFYQGTDIHVLRGDNIRLNFINLGYTIKKIYLYGNIANLGLIWRANDLGIDPDYPNISPPSKVYTIGIRTSL
jgi:TonB-dependent starch-binding outer membrane protein SusC